MDYHLRALDAALADPSAPLARPHPNTPGHAKPRRSASTTAAISLTLMKRQKPRVALLALPLRSAMAGGGASGGERSEGYSFAAGVADLTESCETWRQKRKCVTCHTNGWGLAAQPVIAPKSKEVGLGRAFAQGYLTGHLSGESKRRGQHGSVEGMVATAAFLAMSDARTGTKVHEVTRRGLDHAWSLLDKSGAWDDWLQCNWPPFESDAEYGPTLMLVALGELADRAKIKAADRAGAKRLVRYLKRNQPMSLHAKAMRLWAAHHWPKATPKKERTSWHRELLTAQQKDGGWSMASLAGPTWQRKGGEPQTPTSEAYPTAFCTYVLLTTGTKRTDPTVLAGLDWLRTNQKEDGSWHTRSPRRDGKHYISRAATAFALMALAADE